MVGSCKARVLSCGQNRDNKTAWGRFVFVFPPFVPLAFRPGVARRPWHRRCTSGPTPLIDHQRDVDKQRKARTARIARASDGKERRATREPPASARVGQTAERAGREQRNATTRNTAHAPVQHSQHTRTTASQLPKCIHQSQKPRATAFSKGKGKGAKRRERSVVRV